MAEDDELKPRFGGIPFRAVGDRELTALDLQMLATIAAHDGFNKNRRGCYASHQRLAALTGAHYKSAARCIAKLVERGYVNAAQAGDDGRLRVYRVIYSAADHTAFRGDGRARAPARRLRSVTSSVTDRAKPSAERSVTPSVTEMPPIEAEVGNSVGSRSVTENDEVGNRNASQKCDKPLMQNEKGNRIYSTEGSRSKKRIDRAEAGACERVQSERAERDQHPPDPPDGCDREELRKIGVADLVMNVARRKAVGRQRLVTSGPATDADAAIEQAIGKARDAPSAAPVIELSSIDNARPSKALLQTAACRTALAKAR